MVCLQRMNSWGEILKEVGRDQNNKIQRYKGLGEMDAGAALGDHDGSGAPGIETSEYG